jgi:transmembrane sensor
MDYPQIAAYLAGECSPEEEQALARWIAASPENAREFRRWQAVWEASRKEHSRYEPDLQRAWQRINPANVPQTPFTTIHRESPGRYRTRRVWLRNVAAAVLLVVGLGWGIGRISRTDAPQAVHWVEEISRDAAREVLLSDGTTIWLNAQTTLRYPAQFSGGNREVFLEGEAYFDVTHHPEKPFLVHTAGSVTEVLGTTFTISSYTPEPEVIVHLLSGKVAFRLTDTQPDQQVTLKPGQKAVLNKASQTISVRTDEDPNYLAWKTGKIVFQDVTLGEALRTLERFYRVAFIVADPQLLNCHFTGTFVNAPLEEVLQTFAFGSGIHYRAQGNQYWLSGTGCP